MRRLFESRTSYKLIRRNTGMNYMCHVTCIVYKKYGLWISLITSKSKSKIRNSNSSLTELACLLHRSVFKVQILIDRRITSIGPILFVGLGWKWNRVKKINGPASIKLLLISGPLFSSHPVIVLQRVMA